MVEKNMQKSKIKVVDDFLPIFEFAPIKNQMEGGEFPWYWQEHSHGNFSDGKFKANCNYKTLEQNTGWFHTDYDDDRKNGMTTSIFYVNTNNGGTKFEDGTFVNSVSNRMVTFDCSIKHAPVSCSDVDRIIVVNINYSKIKK